MPATCDNAHAAQAHASHTQCSAPQHDCTNAQRVSVRIHRTYPKHTVHCCGCERARTMCVMLVAAGARTVPCGSVPLRPAPSAQAVRFVPAPGGPLIPVELHTARQRLGVTCTCARFPIVRHAALSTCGGDPRPNAKHDFALPPTAWCVAGGRLSFPVFMQQHSTRGCVCVLSSKTLSYALLCALARSVLQDG